MVSHIKINETIEDRQSWFNIKRFKIGNTSFQKPEKSLDVKSLDLLNYRNVKDAFQFFEATKLLKNHKNIMKIYDADELQIENFFYKGQWLGSARNVINFTLQFNPYNHVKSIEDISWFFDYYYVYSKLFLTVPNIRIERRNKDKKKVRIIDLEGYERFVDETYQLLDDKNNKQIFVPISMKFTTRQLTELLEHYLNQDYLNYWFDFEGRSISENTLARLRHIFKMLKKNEVYRDVVSYFTNIKREKLANSNEDTSVASDALSAVAGANLIGVNREPMMWFESPPPKGDSSKDTIRERTSVDPSHKARIFNRDTYYYVKTKDPDLQRKNRYVTINAVKLNAEFNTQAEYFFEHQEIATLLDEKTMFKDKNARNILKDLTSKSSNKKEEELTHYL